MKDGGGNEWVGRWSAAKETSQVLMAKGQRVGRSAQTKGNAPSSRVDSDTQRSSKFTSMVCFNRCHVFYLLSPGDALVAPCHNASQGEARAREIKEKKKRKSMKCHCHPLLLKGSSKYF